MGVIKGILSKNVLKLYAHAAADQGSFDVCPSGLGGAGGSDLKNTGLLEVVVVPVI